MADYGVRFERYYAILKPLQLTGVDNRGKLMLSIAWLASTICSAPQMVVFQLHPHPNVTWYEQCTTFNTFTSDIYLFWYFMFGMIWMYAFPLSVFIYCYGAILLEIFRRSRDAIGADRARRLDFLGKAKTRTLKMTIIIVLAFVICWTPYYVMCIWYWWDRDSATQADQRVQKILLLFACTNSCMNPLVYGLFNIRKQSRREQSRTRLTIQHSGNSKTKMSSTTIDPRTASHEISMKVLE